MKLGTSIAAKAEEIKKRTEKAVKLALLETGSRIITRSPVDTGRFRGNWQAGVGSCPDGTVERFGANPSLQELEKDLAGLKLGDVFYFFNGLPYGPPLENGHSQQAPFGMVGVTLREFPAILKTAAAKVNRS